jgi:hypothetical protein
MAKAKLAQKSVPSASQILKCTTRQRFDKLPDWYSLVFPLMLAWIAKNPDQLHAAMFTTLIHFEGVCDRHGIPSWLK